MTPYRNRDIGWAQTADSSVFWRGYLAADGPCLHCRCRASARPCGAADRPRRTSRGSMSAAHASAPSDDAGKYTGTVVMLAFENIDKIVNTGAREQGKRRG